MTRLTVLTDFGMRDGYVGAMKGVIASIAPDAVIDDVAHDIPQGDVTGAMWTLGRYWRLYPDGTVHLVVVDPGVGTGRRALALTVDGRHLVAPDNGVVTLALRRASRFRAVRIRERRYVRAEESATFHGRDIFAPAAAHLAAGVGLDALGPGVDDPVLLDLPEASLREGGAEGEVVLVDRFGNAATNVPGSWVRPGATVVVAGRELPLRRTFGDAEPGEALALVNSAGFVEVAVRDGSAARALGIGRGEGVRVEGVEPSEEGPPTA